MVDIDTQAMMEGALMVSEMQVRDNVNFSEIISINLTDDVKNIHQKMALSGHFGFQFSMKLERVFLAYSLRRIYWLVNLLMKKIK